MQKSPKPMFADSAAEDAYLANAQETIDNWQKRIDAKNGLGPKLHHLLNHLILKH